MRGMTKCRICGKTVRSIYRKRHETVLCLKMRKERGDTDMLCRELPKTNFTQNIELPKGQKKLLACVIIYEKKKV